MAAEGWRGKLICDVPDCTFVIYVEGEPTENALTVIVETALTTHFEVNHPDKSPNIFTNPPGTTTVLPPDAAYEHFTGKAPAAAKRRKELVN